MFIKIHVLFAIYFTKVWKVKNFSATHTLQAWSNLGILDLEKNPFILTLIEYEYDRMVKNVIRQTLNYFGHFHHTLQNMKMWETEKHQNFHIVLTFHWHFSLQLRHLNSIIFLLHCSLDMIQQDVDCTYFWKWNIVDIAEMFVNSALCRDDFLRQKLTVSF